MVGMRMTVVRNATPCQNVSRLLESAGAWPMNDDDLDWDALGDAALALMALTLHDGGRAWKQYPWDVTDRLYERGMIDNPRSKAKSVVLTEEGEARALHLLKERFTRAGETGE